MLKKDQTGIMELKNRITKLKILLELSNSLD